MELANESPRIKTPLEWWFFQGFYEGRAVGRKYFMISFFRQHLKFFLFRRNLDDTAGEKEKHTFSLIKAITDTKNHSFHCLSQIHEDVLDALKDKEKFSRLKHESGNLDPLLFKTLMDEIKNYGPPSPIQVESDPVHLECDPLNVQWGDFFLKQKQQSFILSFKDPSNKKPITIELTPLDNVVSLKEHGVPNLETTSYSTYPRMKLSGKSDSHLIKGKAWMDHQWGEFTNFFFLESNQKRFLGWDWIGINLNDGSDLIITNHRDMGTNEIIDRVGFHRPPDSSTKLLDSVTMKPKGYWKSPRTHIRYPVNWTISIPELETELEFTPFLRQQEIPFFGPMRAIWEGAGKVNGVKKGRPISGHARLELHGYGYIFDFKKYLKKFSGKIDKKIESFLPKKMNHQKIERFVGKPKLRHGLEALSHGLSQPVWDLIERKGRRWRPLFVFKMLKSLGVDPEPYEKMIFNIMELNHTGSLIIDDIEDRSLKRRGEECIHLKYGEDVSINAACTLYFLPYLLIQENPHLDKDQKRRLYEVLHQVMIRAHFGQAMDIFWSKNLTEDNYKIWSQDFLEDKILQMYAYKTGAALEGGSEAACIIAKSNDSLYRCYKSLASAFGIVFQLIDDIHNFNSSPKWTKQTGEDISSGKLTYVIHKAIQNSEKKDSDRLLSILCSKEKRNDSQHLKTATEIIKNSGALSACKKEAEDMIEREWKVFSQAVPMTETKVQIKLLITGLINFSYET